jgi:hypothetical protein
MIRFYFSRDADVIRRFQLWRCAPSLRPRKVQGAPRVLFSRATAETIRERNDFLSKGEERAKYRGDVSFTRNVSRGRSCW